MARRIVAALLSLWLAGCEFSVSYRASLPGLPVEDHFGVVRGDGFDLYLAPSPSTDAPGIALIAVAADRPAVAWDWEEFRTWPADEQKRVYGEYYDRFYLAPSVESSDACPIRIRAFDHRESAQERDFAAWLRPGLDRPFDDSSKGLFVEVPLEYCDRASRASAGTLETLVVVVRNQDGETLDTLEVAFSIEEKERYIQWLF